MVFIQQKLNKYPILTIIIFALIVLLSLIPSEAMGDIAQYDTDIDISVSTFNYMFKESDNITDIKTGLYFGLYLSFKSPIFINYFDLENIYNVIELGSSFNEINSTSNYIVSFPLFFDFAYKIAFLKKLSFFPSFGLGFNTVINNDKEHDIMRIDTLVKSGIELKYLVWEETYLKLKLDYGIFFDNTLNSGMGYFLKIRIPFIFLP